VEQQGSQEQEVKFQDPVFTKFQDNFRTFLSVSQGSRHRKCTFFCPRYVIHWSRSVLQS